MDQVVVTAPAQSETPAPPVTAIDQAVEQHDVSSFRDARMAERTGKPLPAATKPESPPEPLPEPPEPPDPDPKPAASAQPVPGISKRQQQINDYERRIAEQEQRIRALESQQHPPAAPRSEPAPPTEPEYKRFRAMPDAPKLDSFDSIEDHAAAMALFIADKRLDEREAKAKQQSDEQRFFEEQDARVRAFYGRVDKIEETDPEFWKHISPEVKALRTRADLKPGERPSAANDLADHILDHEYGPRLMAYLTQHPDVLHRLSSLPARSQLYVELGKLYATFEQPPQPSSSKQLSSAPAPVITLGTKATEPANEIDAAVATHDVSTFRQKRLQQRAAMFKR